MMAQAERDLGRVEGKLDMVITLLTKRGEDFENLNKRVNAIEKSVVGRILKLEYAVASILVGGAGYTAHSFGIVTAIAGVFH